MRVELISRGPDETEALGSRLAAALPDGTAIGLVGGLGCGKTCFARGVAAGLGIDPDDVASPTFVYLVEYSGGRMPLRHADLYRLEGLAPDAAAEAFAGIGLYEALEGPGITVVEWWDRYVGPPPALLTVVEFVVENVDVRSLTLTFSGAALAPVAHGFGGARTR